MIFNFRLVLFVFIDLALFAIALGLLIPISILFIECIAALFHRTKTQGYAVTRRPRIDVLMPAHNEVSGIRATLKTVLPQLTEQDRLIVIADNCDDETAAVARQLGATAIERHEPNYRGKGYALDYGLRFIATDPPAVVVVIDADCDVHSGTIDRLVRLADALTRPVQAAYLLNPPANVQPKDAVSALAFMVKNLVRPRGLEKLGLPCLLTGSGMAFPWSVICKASLASGNIVEDMQLGLDLVIAGHAPVFCSDAIVTGVLPQQRQAAKSQRMRWEHGHLQTLLTQVPRLLKASVHQRRFDLLAITLDLCVPPLSLLVMAWIIAIGGALIAWRLGNSSIPTILLTVEGLLILVSIASAWIKFGSANLPLPILLAVPFYILWKIPFYLAFLVQPQAKWIRTERDVVDA